MLNLTRASHALPLMALLALAACSAGAGTDQLQGVVIDQPQPKPSFVLTDTSGEPYDFVQETRGKLTLLYFGYTNCPDICPVHMAQIAEALDQYPEVADKTVVVFVTVDPNRDTREVLRSFLDNFNPRFVGLTDTREKVEAAEKAAGVPMAEVVGGGEGYSVNHAAWVIAYAPDGLNYSVYPFGVTQNQWSNDLQILARIDGPKASQS
ncbi:MAG TPA: SCO family protein [Acidimicrobiia bacterium]|jgi:protein SCO1/2|nr:SCO family protein [Acidimicrobiia bacterium]